MSIRARCLVVSVVTVLTILPAAHAEFPHNCGRYLGIGWSDGYHSRTACPPKAHFVIHKPIAPVKAEPTPWWKIPSTDVHPDSGPSLFRQPGEGVSVGAPTPAQP